MKATYFACTTWSKVDDSSTFEFSYEMGFKDADPMKFTERVTVPPSAHSSSAHPDVLNSLLESIHIMLGISYYKLYCPSEIRVPKPLSDSQALFWETVYRKGLGEFAFRNDMDLRESISFPRGKVIPTPMDIQVSQRALIGIGGGKDSVVAIELVKQQGTPCDGLVVETYTSHDIADSVCQIAGIGSLKVKRTLDPKVFERLPESFSGHIPISAIYAFLGTLTAILHDYSYVITGNEFSSNFGNIEHHGEEVNHQWSKSAEFESLFNEYLRSTVTPSVRYFSIVRPFYEIRIAELFSQYPAYFSHFTSCNRKFLADRTKQPRGYWCCECPKCAFVFLMLAPFIERNELIRIFGRNLLNDQALAPLYKDILGFGTMKPFDCVGTFDEARAALYMVREAYGDSAIVKASIADIVDGEQLQTLVMKTNQALSVPTNFRFCGMKSALILGYGKEGRSSETYLRRKYPSLIVGIEDAASNPAYLKTQSGYDIVVRTPGIPRRNVTPQYVTATNIFFSEFKGTIIAVTGSKGKSTTASLIHAMLSQAGIVSSLAGNIGVPMLSLLDKKTEDVGIAVIEMSSYQLEDFEYAPHIAVVTSLFPEHLDYHGGADAYYEAKRNITRFQKRSDYFIFNEEFPALHEWTRTTRAISRTYDELSFEKEDIPLLGEHNIANVRAAVSVAHILGVHDEKIRLAVRDFEPLPHRLEMVRNVNGVSYFNDSISTTPESAIAALRAIPNVSVLMLGGLDRGYDFSELEGEIRARKICHLVLFPDSGVKMIHARTGLNILETKNMREAVAFASQVAKSGEVVLLSPASPSYNLFKNFEERGDAFRAEVNAL